ncbi:MAG: DNA cytosine methyltransferase [Nitrospirae bacterium]|nr:DNA cytosine methyltransferase [Nitrospirota bacterium]
MVRPRTLDLFCGGGGSSYGARLAGAEIVCGVDMWEVATETFQDNFPEALAVTAKLGAGTGPDSLDGAGPIDLIIASPECTNHTCARGSRERDEESRRTALYVLDFVEAFKPRWVVIENVIQMRSWEGFAGLLEWLGRDYSVKDMVLDAADFGVPQTRRRLFIVCDREREVPPVVGPGGGVPARRVIDWSGSWHAGPLYHPRRATPTLERAERAIAQIGKGEPFLIVYYGSDGSGGWQPLGRPLRTMTTLDRFGLVRWDGKTPTLRMLQVPELRKAMGFSADYVMRHGSRRDQIKLLGNGVCAPVMKAVVETLTGGEMLPEPESEDSEITSVLG